MTQQGSTAVDAIAIAVVIPAHRQPGLLAEAVASVLAQRDAPPTATVIVDDGCPFPETALTASAFAAAHPGRVFALRRPNGGLSAARNTGIDFALAAFPALRAIYFLDADNRLHPPFLARALAALEAAPVETGWVYPDFDRFGVADPESSARWSLLSELTENMVEAGSLVRRALFEAPHPLRFDEALRGGFEDWDFWLRAAAAGFQGRHLPNAGFRYRRRPESMLAEAERNREALLGTLRRKPAIAGLLAPRQLLALEAAEAPRFALYGADPADEDVRLLLDPAAGAATEVLPPAAARRRLLEAEARPLFAPWFPSLLAFADPAALAVLRQARMLRFILWQAARLVEGAEGVAAVEITAAATADEAGISLPAEPAPAGSAALVLAPRRLLAAAAAPDARPGRLESLAAERPLVALRRLRLTLPAALAPPAAPGTALRRLLLEAAALRATQASRSVLAGTGWRAGRLSPPETAARRAAAVHGSGPLLPCLPEHGRRSIGFVHPLFTLGGVERVVLNQARVLRGRGWRTRLVVLGGGERALLPAVAREAFDDICLVPGRGFGVTDWRNPYLGAEVSGFGARGEAGEILGLLAGLEVVVNTHSLAAHALSARLRRMGTRCYAALHLVERGAWGEAIGTPHSALAYEHALDGALVISEGLAAWCVAQGWPEAKLHLVRNAPGHPTPPSAVVAALAARAARRAGRLRALFLGRLDPQKGVDRLAALIAATRDAVQWRVVGRPVLEAAPPALGLDIEPPVSDPAALDALYAWADVLVLPSRFEGVPLTVLEAQRLGCAVVATEAGEIGEIVADGEDGFLVPQRGREEAAVVADMAGLLRRLAADPALLLEVGRRGAARVAAAGWEETMAGFLAHLDTVVPPRGAAA